MSWEAASFKHSSPSQSGSYSSGSLQSSSSPCSSTPQRVPETSPDSSSTRPQNASGVISNSSGNVTRSNLLLDHSNSNSNNNIKLVFTSDTTILIHQTINIKTKDSIYWAYPPLSDKVVQDPFATVFFVFIFSHFLGFFFVFRVVKRNLVHRSNWYGFRIQHANCPLFSRASSRNSQSFSFRMQQYCVGAGCIVVSIMQIPRSATLHTRPGEQALHS